MNNSDLENFEKSWKILLKKIKKSKESKLKIDTFRAYGFVTIRQNKKSEDIWWFTSLNNKPFIQLKKNILNTYLETKKLSRSNYIRFIILYMYDNCQLPKKVKIQNNWLDINKIFDK